MRERSCMQAIAVDQAVEAVHARTDQFGGPLAVDVDEIPAGS